MVKQLPIAVKASHKTDMRSQFAALCFRERRGKPEILLITSRRTGRWIIPKGWPLHDKTPSDSAAREAWEEAGVEGKALNQCIGLYSYSKAMEDRDDLPCIVMVYPFKVKNLARNYPERKERRRKWFSTKRASQAVAEPELARILRDFDPRRLR